MDRNAPLFELFWHNSKLNSHTSRQLERRIAVDAATLHPPAWRARPDFDIRLADPPAGHLHRRWPRESIRRFGTRPLGPPARGTLVAGGGRRGAHHPRAASRGGA